MGQRRKKEDRQRWWGKEAPLWTIVVRRRYTRGRVTCRYIKIAMAGPRRWKFYATWLWERQHGPKPPGMRVGHIDGNTLNDNLANLDLFTPGQIAQRCHRLDPKMSAANYRKMAVATAAMNVVRGQSGRVSRWMPSRWYAVDLERQEVHCYATRSRRQLIRHLGGDCSINGRVTRAVPFQILRGSEVAERCPGFRRVVPDYRSWRAEFANND